MRGKMAKCIVEQRKVAWRYFFFSPSEKEVTRGWPGLRVHVLHSMHALHCTALYYGVVSCRVVGANYGRREGGSCRRREE